MIEEAEPPASVFTTLRWNGTSVAWLDEHLNRLNQHAKRLSIKWPKNMGKLLQQSELIGEGNLCNIQLNRDGTVKCTLRESVYSDSPLTELSQAAPRFSEIVQGTKHAEWDGYSAARKLATKDGADIALLVHDGAVVDGDRCTPILLDIDGVAYAPSPEGGGIDSITLQLLIPEIEAGGIPFRYARLTETMLGRSSEVIVVGTGVGVAWLSEIDGQSVGRNSPGPLYETCNNAFQSKLNTAWTSLGAD